MKAAQKERKLCRPPTGREDPEIVEINGYVTRMTRKGGGYEGQVLQYPDGTPAGGVEKPDRKTPKVKAARKKAKAARKDRKRNRR
jgi:hypothetical protein